MALKGKDPELVEKRLKALFFGESGAGKTTAAISFPRPYLIDTERGSENDEYVEILKSGGGQILQTNDFDEIINEVKELLTVKHPYKTLIIDPLTGPYNDLLDKCALELKNAAKEKDATGTEFGRHYGPANKKMKQLMNLLLRLDMNVIITSHAKDKYSSSMSVIDTTFDCYKKLDYLFDLVFQVQKRGNSRVAIVKKSRIKAFKDSETFDFSYDEMANRYGRSVIERDAIPQELASPEDVAEYNRLVKLLNIPEDKTDKWLDKANAQIPEELPKPIMKKLLDHLQKTITGEVKE